jgi:alpha-1,3-rhamnosyl/mannosyltransferase
VVTGAQRVADELLADGWHADQVLVCPHGADHVSPPDHEAARALLERHGVTGSFLVTAATLEPRKNLRRVVVAHRQLAEHGAEIPLVVVGPTGWGSDGLDGAGPDVVLLGEVPGPVLSALFADAELVLALSLAEGYGLPVLEAMSLGAVVLASSTTPAALELGCRVVDPTDVDAIAEELNLLLHDSVLRAQHRDAALQVTANRTWANAAAHHESFWRRLV